MVYKTRGKEMKKYLLLCLCLLVIEVKGQTDTLKIPSYSKLSDFSFIRDTTLKLAFRPDLKITRFNFCNSKLQRCSFIFEDTLKIESDMPLSEGAELFINYIKGFYNSEIAELQRELNKCKERNESLRIRLQVRAK
jgi:hypothetical protein